MNQSAGLKHHGAGDYGVYQHPDLAGLDWICTVAFTETLKIIVAKKSNHVIAKLRRDTKTNGWVEHVTNKTNRVAAKLSQASKKTMANQR